jgi:hypothetical protein
VVIVICHERGGQATIPFVSELSDDGRPMQANENLVDICIR